MGYVSSERAGAVLHASWLTVTVTVSWFLFYLVAVVSSWDIQYSRIADSTLPGCTEKPAFAGTIYTGFSDATGLTTLESEYGEPIQVVELEGYSGVRQAFSFENRVTSVVGFLIDYSTYYRHLAEVDFWGFETGGGDTKLLLKVGLPWGISRYFEGGFYPTCYSWGVVKDYMGPYLVRGLSDRVYAITCTYRTTGLGYPVKCYNGISQTEYVEDSDMELSLLRLQTLSHPTMASWSLPETTRNGVYSVRGVGIWEGETYSGCTKFSLIGTMHISNGDASVEQIVVVEGYVTLPLGAVVTEIGVLRLATWETVHQFGPVPGRTANIPPLKKVSSWTCTDITPNVFIMRPRTCYYTDGKSGSVVPTDLVSTGSIFSTVGTAPEACRSSNRYTNDNHLIVADYLSDSYLKVTRIFDGINVVYYDFTFYGVFSTKRESFRGTPNFHTCTRIAVAETPYFWAGVNSTDTTMWPLALGGAIGCDSFQSTVSDKVRHARWGGDSYVTSGSAGSAVTSQNYKSFNIELQNFHYRTGSFPEANWEDTSFESLTNPVHFNTKQLTHMDFAMLNMGDISVEPDGIVCAMAIEESCLSVVEPVCRQSVGGRMVEAAVQFPVDIFFSMDLVVHGNTQYIGSVTILNEIGQIVGAPVAIDGMIYPIFSPGEKVGPAGGCSSLLAVGVTIHSQGSTLTQNTYERSKRMVDHWTSRFTRGSPNGLVVVRDIKPWFATYYGSTSWGALGMNLPSISILSTCNNEGGCNKHWGSPSNDQDRLRRLQTYYTDAVEGLISRQKSLKTHSYVRCPKYEQASCILASSSGKQPNSLSEVLYQVACFDGPTIYILANSNLGNQEANFAYKYGQPDRATLYGYAMRGTTDAESGSRYPTIISFAVYPSSGHINPAAGVQVNIGGQDQHSPDSYFMVAPMYTGHPIPTCGSMRGCLL